MAWLAGFVILGAIGAALAAYSRDEDARLLAVGLLLLALSVIPAWYGHALYLLPLYDWALGCASFVMWLTRHATWLRSFVILAGLRLSLHVAVALLPESARTPFIHLLNACFVMQVLLISKQGGIRLGADFAGRVLPQLRDLRHRVFGPPKAIVGHG